jgi:hypothetical protein
MYKNHKKKEVTFCFSSLSTKKYFFVLLINARKKLYKNHKKKFLSTFAESFCFIFSLEKVLYFFMVGFNFFFSKVSFFFELENLNYKKKKSCFYFFTTKTRKNL